MNTSRLIAIVLIIALLSLIVSLIEGCTTTKYIPVETVKTEYKDRNVYTRDSMIIMDSVVFREKGDTILKEKWRTVYKDRWHTLTDSVIVVDSVQVPYPVERKLTKWEQMKLDIGGITLSATVLLIFFVVVWLVRTKSRR